MKSNLDQVLVATNAQNCGGGQYIGHCPAHEDQNKSLSIKETSNGELLMYCHAGCSYQQIKRTLTEMGVLEVENA